jgi:hypothetical protein
LTPPNVPAVWAALYLALHSFMVSALAWPMLIARNAVIVAAAITNDFIDSLPSLDLNSIMEVRHSWNGSELDHYRFSFDQR